MPWLGIEQGRLGRIQTLYHVTLKAGSYSKAVQVLINYALPHIPPTFLDSSLKLN